MIVAEVSRRDALKVAAGLAVGVGVGTAGSALGQQSSKPADAPQPAKSADDSLARAKENPEGFMLSEPQVFTLETDGYSHDLVITSARNEKGDRVQVIVPSRSVRFFRADTTVDEFTRQGGLYWRFRDQPGKVKLKKTAESTALNPVPGPGQLVMLVRDEETVRLYTMMLDLRC